MGGLQGTFWFLGQAPLHEFETAKGVLKADGSSMGHVILVAECGTGEKQGPAPLSAHGTTQPLPWQVENEEVWGSAYGTDGNFRVVPVASAMSAYPQIAMWSGQERVNQVELHSLGLLRCPQEQGHYDVRLQ